MDRAIVFHHDLESAITEGDLNRETILSVLSVNTWSFRKGSDRFVCSDRNLEITAKAEDEEIFIENIFKLDRGLAAYVLFDIDGTLLHSSGAGKKALCEALIDTFGTTGPVDSYSFSGKLDPNIISELMGAAGISADRIEESIPLCLDRYVTLLETYLPGREVNVMPGVPELLEILQSRPGIQMALCTGNIREGAFLKLKACALDRFFKTGAFGGDARDRNRLPGIAVERLQRSSLVKADVTRVFVVGDAPADVYSAHHSGYHSVAVLTGFHSRQELEQTGPTILLEDLSNPDSLTGLIGATDEGG